MSCSRAAVTTDGGETWTEVTRNKGLPAEGLVHVTTLSNGDYYDHDKTSHTLTGRRSGEVFRLGDSVRVRVVRVDVDRREAAAQFAGEGPVGGGAAAVEQADPRGQEGSRAHTDHPSRVLRDGSDPIGEALVGCGGLDAEPARQHDGVGRGPWIGQRPGDEFQVPVPARTGAPSTETRVMSYPWSAPRSWDAPAKTSKGPTMSRDCTPG